MIEPTQTPVELPPEASMPPEATTTEHVEAWKKIGEGTLAYLEGPSDVDPTLTRLEALDHQYGGSHISMNGENSKKANTWNSANTRLGPGQTDPKDYIFSVYVPNQPGVTSHGEGRINI